ncbi:TolC family protein [Methylobacillus gramineus]|uniref:TolC family protein n=1 Tax=Methylobacillus gramineus TaxID=755169 RepID=UPI001CFFF02B|nr:TolC family protein [Methylobacillus gramineus]MCB5186254.1 TolC family protein [Methylobacillus gramineus]
MVQRIKPGFSIACSKLLVCLGLVAGGAGLPAWAESVITGTERTPDISLPGSLDLNTISRRPAQTLDEGAADAQQQYKLSPPKKLKINLDEVLAQGRTTQNLLPGGVEHGLSIVDVRAKALQNNLSLKVVQFDPQMAESALGAERAKFDNIIYASLRRSRENRPLTSGDIVQLKAEDAQLDGQLVKLNKAEQQIDYLDGEAGIAIPLRTGGMVRVSTPFERKLTEGSLGTDEYRRATRFSISQPLLRNAGVKVNEASIRIAELDRQAIDAKTRLQSIRVVSLIDKAYWDVYAAWAELDVRHQQYELAARNLDMVRRKVEEGLVASIEGSRAEIGVSDKVEALIMAKTRLQLSQRQLQFLLNDPQYAIGGSTLIRPQSEPILVNYEFDRDRLVDSAMQGRLELLELEVKLAADINKIEYLQNQTLPLFTLDYSYGALSAGTSSLSRAYDSPFDNRFNEWSVGVRFELPMTNEARRNQLQQAVQQRMQRLSTKELQVLTVKREIYDVVDQAEQHWQRILAARQQVMLAGVNYDGELKQFNEGLRNMTEVLEMLGRLGESQIKEIRAIEDYQAALIDIAYATGTLLGYGHVEFGS